MKLTHDFKAGEGTLKASLTDEGLTLKYSSIDDCSIKQLTVDDLMKLLGYKKGN